VRRLSVDVENSCQRRVLDPFVKPDTVVLITHTMPASANLFFRQSNGPSGRAVVSIKMVTNSPPDCRRTARHSQSQCFDNLFHFKSDVSFLVWLRYLRDVGAFVACVELEIIVRPCTPDEITSPRAKSRFAILGATVAKLH